MGERKKFKPVYQFDLNENLIATHKNTKEAAIVLDTTEHMVRKALNESYVINKAYYLSRKNTMSIH